jgi:thioredoxin reductase (NADPH)
VSRRGRLLQVELADAPAVNAHRVVVAIGRSGNFRRLGVGGEELGKVSNRLHDPTKLRGQRVLVVGGGDSALDWTLALKDLAADTLLIHRRGSFRAVERSTAELRVASEAGELSFRDHHEVKEIRGNAKVESVVIFDNRTGEETVLEVDAVLTFLGFKPDLGPMKGWGLELAGNRVLVDRLMRTSLPNVFAVGDMVTYDGKLDLIATGFAEAAIAVNQAVRILDPNARVNPGHSTNLKIFREPES